MPLLRAYKCVHKCVKVKYVCISMCVHINQYKYYECMCIHAPVKKAQGGSQSHAEIRLGSEAVLCLLRLFPHPPVPSEIISSGADISTMVMHYATDSI